MTELKTAQERLRRAREDLALWRMKAADAELGVAKALRRCADQQRAIYELERQQSSPIAAMRALMDELGIGNWSISYDDDKITIRTDALPSFEHQVRITDTLRRFKRIAHNIIFESSPRTLRA